MGGFEVGHFVAVGHGGGSGALLLFFRARRGQLVVGDQALGQRAAEQAADDQAEGGAGDAQGGGAGQAVLAFQHRAPGAGGAVAAHQGDGAGDQADQRIKPQQGGQAYAYGVLHHDEDGDHAQEDEQASAAFAQLGEVGAQADRREENQHEGRLQAAFKAHRQAREQMDDKDAQGHHQTAGDGLGDVEVAQKADVAREELAEQEHQNGHDEGVVRAKSHVHKRFSKSTLAALWATPA